MILSMENISKIYNGKTVLDNVSLTVEDGDRIGLVGINGCGKSTLLRIITGKEEYETQPEPNIPVFSSVRDSSIGFLEQNSGLDRSSTVMEEMLSVFSDLLEAQEEMRRLELEMSKPEVHEDRERFELISREYDRKNALFEAKDGYNIDVRIKTVLNGMGFPSETYGRVISTLSGGEKTRLAMARLLLENPRLLILDEPTNHLDFDTVVWLEDYLCSYKGALLIVSHDRYFLDKICTSICEIERTRLRRWKGNYSKFTELKAADVERRMKEYEAQQEEIAKLQDFVDRNIVRATTSAMAKSRVKKLEAMELLEKPVTGEKRAKIRFEYDYEPPLDVLTVKNMGLKAGDKKLADNISFTVRRGDKIGIVGANGIGKTTLLKAVGGSANVPRGTFVSHGTAEWTKNVKISYFDQENSQLDFSKTVIDEIHDRRRGMTEQQVRSLLGLVKFTGENVFKQVGVISGGERAKLGFAVMMLERGNVLILDEPTNHLDIDAKEVLEEALCDYGGTVMLVSHDRYLLSRVCSRIFEITPEGLNVFDGGFEDYMAKRREASERERAAAEAEKQERLRSEREEKKNAAYRSKEQRARDAQRRGRIKELERLIEELDEKMALVQEEIASPEVAADYRLMNEKCGEYERLKQQSSEYSDEWLELSEQTG
ncbi:MAG: ABC-F family ATP-binding cassette domain-containing protein [Ruminococcus sp.]|nr:ABC-F family ATP-binding cassette domain-containing protein [Ruminococcus sp.]